METEVIEFGWNNLQTEEDIEKLTSLFCDFEDARLSDVKYFSADSTEVIAPDVSDETACYVKFHSYNPEIAANVNANEIIIKFVGMQRVNIASGIFNYGKQIGVTFDLLDQEDLITLTVENQENKNDEPTLFIAKNAYWNYDYGDDLK